MELGQGLYLLTSPKLERLSSIFSASNSMSRASQSQRVPCPRWVLATFLFFHFLANSILWKQCMHAVCASVIMLDADRPKRGLYWDYLPIERLIIMIDTIDYRIKIQIYSTNQFTTSYRRWHRVVISNATRHDRCHGKHRAPREG